MKSQSGRHAVQCTQAAVIKTVAVYAINICAGLISTIVGSTLLDLQARVAVPIDLAAMFVGWLYLGRLPGVLAASLVFDRTSAEPALVGSTALMAVLVSVIPWTDCYASMAVVIALTGACTGFVGVGVNRYCFRLWSEPLVRQIVQSLNFFFSVGVAVSPLLANRFITDQTPSSSHVTDDVTRRADVTVVHDSGGKLLNETTVIVVTRSSWNAIVDDNATYIDGNISQAETWHEYQLYKPFAVAAGLQLVACLMLLAVHVACGLLHDDTLSSSSSSSSHHHNNDTVNNNSELSPTAPLRQHQISTDAKSLDPGTSHRCLDAEHLHNHQDDVTSPMTSLAAATAADNRQRVVLTSRRRIVLSVLFSVLMLLHSNVEVNYGNLLLPYCVRHLVMTETTGNDVAFAYWLATAVGRFIGIFVSRFVSPTRLLTADVIVGVVSLTVSTSLAGGGDSAAARWAVWPCSVVLGLGVSTVFASTISLSAEYVGVSSPLVAAVLGSFAAGCVVGPTVCGVLFRRLGPVWLVRYTLGAALLEATVFVVIRVVYARAVTSLRNKSTRCSDGDNKKSVIYRERV